MPQNSTGVAPSFLFRLYRAATGVLLPFAYRKVARKLAVQGLDKIHQRERLGHASVPRPQMEAGGSLIWFHGASVGESQAALILINQLAHHLPQARFLLTAGTATAAKLAKQRMPQSCHFQFAPLDSVGPVRRFLGHWRPDAAIFVDSELWPVTLVEARNSGAVLALVNARLSERSIARWRKRSSTARFILDQFTLLMPQNEMVAEALLSLGAAKERILPGGNLKAAAAALPVSDDLVSKLRQDLQGRPVWVASSTHKGEEEIILQTHTALLETHPDLCLVLAPRHPERGAQIVDLIRGHGLEVAQRSKTEQIDAKTKVYLADTLGELGNWYHLSPIVFLGGSLVPVGGHNPFEVALANAAVLTGPETFNFAETFPEMIATGAAQTVKDAQSLAMAVDNWLKQPQELNQARQAARRFTRDQASQLDDLVHHLIEGLALQRSQ